MRMIKSFVIFAAVVLLVVEPCVSLRLTAFSLPPSGQSEAALNSPLFRVSKLAASSITPQLPPRDDGAPFFKTVRKHIRHASVLAVGALVWRGVLVPQVVHATTAISPLAEVRTPRIQHFLTTAGSVLIATGAGVVLGQSVQLRREKEETTSEPSLPTTMSVPRSKDALDDPVGLQQARAFVENTLTRIRKSREKNDTPTTRPSQAPTGLYLMEIPTNADFQSRSVASFCSYVDKLTINARDPIGVVAPMSYLDYLCDIKETSVAHVEAGNSSTLVSSPNEMLATAPPLIPSPPKVSVNKAKLTAANIPVMSVPKPAKKQTKKPASNGNTKILIRTSRNKEPSGLKLQRSPTTRLSSTALAAASIADAEVSNSGKRVKDEATSALSKVAERLIKTLSNFSPKAFREEAESIVAKEKEEIEAAQEEKTLSQKYAAIDSLEERAFAILMDLGMVEVHEDPDSPDYNSHMDHKFVDF